MGVMTAINFKAFYARLKAKSKHTTQDQIAVMRKMIIVAHALYKNDKKYLNPSKNTEVITSD